MQNYQLSEVETKETSSSYNHVIQLANIRSIWTNRRVAGSPTFGSMKFGSPFGSPKGGRFGSPKLSSANLMKYSSANLNTSRKDVGGSKFVTLRTDGGGSKIATWRTEGGGSKFNLSTLRDFPKSKSLFYVRGETVFELVDFGMSLEVKNLCGKKMEIDILKHINALVKGGEIMAIMGPSGAGKTSLLECATLNQPKNSKITGTVTINMEPLTADMFQKHCYIVHQNDYLASRLTCEETLMFAAKNCITNRERISSHVDELIECLGLEECKDVRVGDDFNPGLSGGQKRRLSVCLALVKMPKFLFLDEPTSGLDAASAFKICEHIQLIAVGYNIAALLTIHQPNTKIWQTFNKLLLLHRGEVMYFGPSSAAENYFSELGRPLPPKTNIADYLLDVLEDETLPIQEKAFNRSKLTEHMSVSEVLSCMNPKIIPRLESKPRPSLCRQSLSTLHREVLIIRRDPMLYTGRCASFVVMSVFFALVYIKSAERNQDQVLPRLWLLVWLISVPSCMACVLIFGHAMDILNLYRNVRNGIMHPLPLLVSRLLQLPMMLVFSICSVTIGGYFMCNWTPEKYYIIVIIHAITLTCMELLAELLAVITPHFSVGMLAFMGVWFAQFLFGGLLTKDEDVMWPMRIICYILPLRYGTKAMVYEEYIDSIYQGVLPCNATSDPWCYPGGYKCDTLACYGETGKEVLDSMNINFRLISSTNQTTQCITYMLIFAISIKVLYIMRIMWILKYN